LKVEIRHRGCRLNAHRCGLDLEEFCLLHRMPAAHENATEPPLVHAPQRHLMRS
jgi:hypothetical protein